MHLFHIQERNVFGVWCSCMFRILCALPSLSSHSLVFIELLCWQWSCYQTNLFRFLVSFDGFAHRNIWDRKELCCCRWSEHSLPWQIVCVQLSHWKLLFSIGLIEWNHFEFHIPHDRKINMKWNLWKVHCFNGFCHKRLNSNILLFCPMNYEQLL